MAEKRTKDSYCNILQVGVTMSAANTDTWEEVDIGLNVFDKVGILLQRIEVFPDYNIETQFQTQDTQVRMCLSQDNTVTDLTVRQRSVIDGVMISAFWMTAVGIYVFERPIVRDFTNLMGGGILIAPRPLYVGMASSGATAALAASMRIYFATIPLKPEEYFELLEARRYYG